MELVINRAETTNLDISKKKRNSLDINLGTGSFRPPKLLDRTFDENGTYIAPGDYDGFGTIVIDVKGIDIDLETITNEELLELLKENVPILDVKLEDITITENGIYVASDGYDGLGTVKVDIASDVTDEIWYEREVESWL